MTNILQLSAQLANFGANDPQAAQQVWAAALQDMPSDQLRKLMAALPPTGAMPAACRDGLLSLALERHSVPMGLGPK